MIVGIGADIVKVSRIAASLERKGDALARRVLTPAELARFHASRVPAAFLAKRFAAKEAASKAFGTGIGRISWQDLEVVNNEDGAPRLLCHGNAATRMRELGATQVHISLADEEDAALAFVILSADLAAGDVGGAG